MNPTDDHDLEPTDLNVPVRRPSGWVARGARPWRDPRAPATEQTHPPTRTDTPRPAEDAARSAVPPRKRRRREARQSCRAKRRQCERSEHGGCGVGTPRLERRRSRCAKNAEVHQRERVHPVNRVDPLDCSPDGIRTHATALRGRRPGPLDDGAPGFAVSCGGTIQHRDLAAVLGYQDSNLD
jgi:hypothetical protein